MLRREKVMEKVEDYMAVAIDSDGETNYLGYSFNYNYHALCLMDYASKKYPNISGFENIDYMADPNKPVYFLTRLNEAIFTNVSVDDGKRGMLYLPKKMSEKQIQALYDFAEEVADFGVCVVYNMGLVRGVVVGKTFDFNSDLKLTDKLHDFTSRKKR